MRVLVTATEPDPIDGKWCPLVTSSTCLTFKYGGRDGKYSLAADQYFTF